MEAATTAEPQPQVHVSLRIRTPFDFALTARVLRRSTRNVIDQVDEDGTWSRVVVLGRGPALVRGHQHGETVTFEAAPANAGDRRTLAALVTQVFSLDVDVSPYFHRLRRERGFADIARRCAGLRPQRFATLWETLANGLACQQLTLESGLMRLGRLCERFGPPTPDGTRVGPPDPGRVANAPVSVLRQAGFSVRRAVELRELARLPLDRFEAELRALSDDEARARLLELPGVGPWTADYVLLRGLGRLDVFPAGDVGAARTLGRILGRAIAPARAGHIAARFSPFRGMLYFCMLGFVLSAPIR
jgi:DNA-3-methyladenine glycosylase II